MADNKILLFQLSTRVRGSLKVPPGETLDFFKDGKMVSGATPVGQIRNKQGPTELVAVCM